MADMTIVIVEMANGEQHIGVFADDSERKAFEQRLLETDGVSDVTTRSVGRSFGILSGGVIVDAPELQTECESLIKGFPR